MHIYKELSFVGEKTDFDEFKNLAPALAHGDWVYSKNKRLMNDYIAFDYLGNSVDQAEVSIYYGPDSWRNREIKVGNIVPIQKNQLSIDEYNAVLDLFYQDIILPYLEKHPNLKAFGPTSELFDPLRYITDVSLKKLEHFCSAANKTTGSAYPSDEKRWFDFICQTVDDEKVFDYDTIYRFLMDEDYWGKKPDGFLGAMGHFAWDEEHASKLAEEYDDYVRILQFYKDKKWNEAYEDAQK